MQERLIELLHWAINKVELFTAKAEQCCPDEIIDPMPVTGEPWPPYHRYSEYEQAGGTLGFEEWQPRDLRARNIAQPPYYQREVLRLLIKIAGEEGEWDL